MKYNKHFIKIRDKVIDFGNGFSISGDLDEGIIECTFELPDYKGESFTTASIKKYDACDIYFGTFDSQDDANNAELGDLKQEVWGYVHSLVVNEDKEGGINYSMTVKGTYGLTKERTAHVSSYSGYLSEIIIWGMKYTDMAGYLGGIDDSGVVNNFAIKVKTSNVFFEVMQGIKEDYALYIYQNGDGVLIIESPSYLAKKSLTVYEYDLEESVFTIDYGELNNNIDSVVVHGLNCVGIAFDPITYQLKNSLSGIPASTEIDLTKLNPLKIYNLNLQSEEDCQKLAQEKIVEIAKNYSITINCAYDSRINLGSMIRIKNSKVIPDTQLWIVKKRDLSFSKEDLSFTLTLYSNSVSDFPEDRLLGSSGLLDTDMLNITSKVESTF